VEASSALLLGLVLGLRHAVDPDHVVVVSTLLSREPSVRSAVGLSVLWGLGHSLAFLGVGLGVVLWGLRVPESFEVGASMAVGLLLAGVGVWQLAHPPSSRDGASMRLRPLAVGVVHGLAGSAGIALLTLTTLPTRAAAAVHLVLFAVGTVLGMIALTGALARPMGVVLRSAQGEQWLRWAAAATGVGLGTWIVAAALSR